MVAYMIASPWSGLIYVTAAELSLGENWRVGPHGHGLFCGYLC